MQETDSIKPNRPLFIGVAGGSGSGKTYFARDLQKALGEKLCTVISQDNFYIDQSHRFDFDGGSVNFDHPSSLDFTRLSACLTQLKNGRSTEIPIYDFATHSRLQDTLLMAPTSVVLVDGILIFHSDEVVHHFDQRYFFETPEELRYARRLKRDVEERGRTPEGVFSQFMNQVKPMHDQFVEPSKVRADRIFKDLGNYESDLKIALEWIQKKLAE